MKPALSQKGFTLIELLIVISLIIVITGAVIPSFNTYIDNQNVKQAQEAVKDDMRTIQNKALNGELAQTELDGNKVKYWGIEFVQDSPTYIYFISVDTTICGEADTVQRQRTSSPLPGESVIRNPSGCVFFSFSNGDVDSTLTGDINGYKVTVGADDGQASGCRRLNVTLNGLIQIETGDVCAP
ncbi:prepilin-type N-terminal cleavage/methylation domain-containing protein [Patescibacteria group bacterium]